MKKAKPVKRPTVPKKLQVKAAKAKKEKLAKRKVSPDVFLRARSNEENETAASLVFLDEIEKTPKQSGKGKKAMVVISTPEHAPLAETQLITITISAPFLLMENPGYETRHLNMTLTASDAKVAKALLFGLQKNGARLASGNIPNSIADAVRYLLQQFKACQ